MFDYELPLCVQHFLQTVLAHVSTEADRQAVWNLRPLLFSHGEPDENGYFWPPGTRRESLLAPYSSEPLRGVLLAHADLLRACEDEFIISVLRDLVDDDVPDVVRAVRTRAWLKKRLRVLRDELARAPEANVATDLQQDSNWCANVPENIAAAVRSTFEAAQRGDNIAVMVGIRKALSLIEESPIDFELRGIE